MSRHFGGRLLVRGPSLKDAVQLSWFVVVLAVLMLVPPTPNVWVLYVVVLPAGLLALSVAVIGTLVLIFRRFSRLRDEDVADYDDEGATGRCVDDPSGADRLPDEKPLGPPTG